jgi:hypothetical protein
MNTKLYYLRFYKNKMKLEGKSNESEIRFWTTQYNHL